MLCSQEEARMKISKILSKKFISISPSSFPPSSILTTFFSFIPEIGIKFMDKVGEVYSSRQLKTVGVKISKKLLQIYDGFTHYPSPRDITTDIFAELAKYDIQVIIPRDRTTTK